MFKKVAISLVCLSFLINFDNAQADTGMTITTGIGKSVWSVKNDDVFGNDNSKLDNIYQYSLGVGYMLENNLETIVEVSKKKIDLVNKSGEKKSLSNDLTNILFKGVYYFPSDNVVSLFVFGGLGVSNVDLKINDTQIVDNKYKFSYEIGAGVSSDIGEKMKIGAEIKYFGLMNLDKEDGSIENDNVIKTRDINIGGFVKFII